jgi:thiopeptide-type bacteriocin biosynthesis protein
VQANIAFSDWDRAEPAVLACLGPRLLAAEADGLISAWFFIRKRPCWRIRYLPAAAGLRRQAQASVEDQLSQMVARRLADAWTRTVYEPEIHAFGGSHAMTTAHRLFHQDSSCLLASLRNQAGGGHRREVSLMLCALLMRAARQEWYEQGDTWARVARHRPSPARSEHGSLPAAVRRLITVDGESQMRDNAPLAYCAPWAHAYRTAGRELAGLADDGLLHRGLRDILAHHVIFAWNRLGLPYATQAALAAAAQTVVFGPDPATQPARGKP